MGSGQPTLVVIKGLLPDSGRHLVPQFSIKLAAECFRRATAPLKKKGTLACWHASRSLVCGSGRRAAVRPADR